jgi:hypothetical protein
MVRLDKSDSRRNVRLKSIVVEVYSLLTANDGKLAFNVSLAVGQVTVMSGHHAQIAICIGAYARDRMYSFFGLIEPPHMQHCCQANELCPSMPLVISSKAVVKIAQTKAP